MNHPQPTPSGFCLWPIETFTCFDCQRDIPLAWAVYLGEDCGNSPTCPECAVTEPDDEFDGPFMTAEELAALASRWEDWNP